MGGVRWGGEGKVGSGSGKYSFWYSISWSS